MKRLCRKYRLGETVKVQNPKMNGTYTIIGQNSDGSYTLWDGQQEYKNVPSYDLMSDDSFKVGDKVQFKDGDGTIYTIKDVMGDDIFFIENDNEALTGIRGSTLKLAE